MWLLIAAQNGDEKGKKYSQLLVKEMNAVDIANARAIAKECVENGYAEC